MRCISSPAFEDAQLVSFIDGEADEAIVAHIEQCSFCREKTNRWLGWQKRLQGRLYRHACPSPMKLGELHLGLLASSEKLVVTQHLRECPECRREIAQLENFMETLTSQPDRLKPIKTLIAQLIGSSAGTPVYGALRGESKGLLIYEIDGIVITLDLQPTQDGQVSILGQVATDDQDQWTGAKVEMQYAGDLPGFTTEADDLGAFRFEKVPIGSTEIKITTSHGIIVQIPNINITN